MGIRAAHWLFLISSALFVIGIGFVVVGAREARRAPQASSQPVATPVASIKQIMNGIVVPASTLVYDAVSTTVTEKGIEDKVPQNEEEWATVGSSAAALAEASNLLMAEGRAVDRGDWIKMAQAMLEASKATLTAVDAKSTTGVLEAGSNLNISCDNCHQRYQR